MRVTVITTCYNAENTIAQTMLSLQSQSLRDYEHVIIDAASTDDTVCVAKQHADHRVRIISEPDNGIFDGYNKGLVVANGDIIGFLNSDDVYYDNESLRIIVDNISDNIDCVHGDLIYVDRRNLSRVIRVWESCDYRDGMFKLSWTPAHPTFYCKSDLYRKYGNYRTDFRIAADVELMYRFIEKHRVNSKHIPQKLVRMRNGGTSNKNALCTFIITQEVIRGIRQNGGKVNVFWYVWCKLMKAQKQLVAK